jgi:hypothetical protein
MIRKYKDKGMFEQEPFGSLGQALEGTSYGVPSTKQQQNKMNPSLVEPIAKPRLSTPSLSFNSLGKQSELPYKNPNTPQYDLNYRLPSLNTDNGAGGNSVLREGAFGQEQSQGADGANSGGTTGQSIRSGATSKDGVSGAGTGKRPFKMQSFDDFTKGIKGSGIYADEALQMGLPYLFRLFNKPPVAKFKRTQDVINPATGLPYETIQQAKGNIQRGLVAATRNKSTDLMTNAAMAAMAAANAAQQQNDIDVKNAGQYIGERKSVGQAIIKNKDANDDFYNRNEAMRVESITNQQNSDKLQAKETAGQIGQIAAQNRAEKNMKMQAAQPFYQQQMQAKFDKEHGETKAAGIDAANKMNEAKSLIAEFDKLDADPKTDKQSASYLEAQRKAATAKTDLETNKTTWLQSINKLKGLQEEFNLELSKQGMSQLKKSKGGLIFKKGGSLSVSDRKELKEHEFALKERLESAKQRAKEANERYKELKKQELEFRKSLTKSSMEGYKIIDNFYKKYKK